MINLRKFNPKWMEERRIDPDKGPTTSIFIGSRGSGKTFLIQDIIYYHRKTPAGMIFTGSETSAENFSEFFPKSFIYDKVDDAAIAKLERVVKEQRKLRKKKVDYDYSSLLLFDDCGYDKKIVNTEVIRGIFMNGRHWKILLMMAVQYCKSVPPCIRLNCDYIFIFREPSKAERRKLWTEYAGIIPELKQFEAIMDKCTENFGCIVIDRTSKSNKIEDSVFWYKAKYPPKKFKVGTKELWEYHNKYYNSDYDDDEEQIPIKNKIIVKKKASNHNKEKSNKKKT